MIDGSAVFSFLLKWISRLERFVLLPVCGAAVLGLTLLVAADAIARYVLHGSIANAGAIATDLLMPIIVFVGMSYAIGQGAHIRIDLFMNRFSAPARRAAELAAGMIAVVVWSVIAQRYLSEMRVSASQSGSVLPGIPAKYTLGIIGIGSLLAALRTLLMCCEPFLQKDREDVTLGKS